MSRANKQNTDEPSTKIIRPSAVADFQDTNEIQSNLECPVCREIMFPPIYSCTAGHSVCCGCIKHLNNKCPLCKAKLGNARNFTLEKLVEGLRFNCRNKVDGCGQNVLGSDFQSHVEICCYKPVQCPFALDEGCSELIRISNYYDHIKNAHLPAVQYFGGQYQQGKHTLYDHNGCQLSVAGYKKTWAFDNQLFMSEITVDVFNQKFQYRLYILGNPDQAQEYKAELFIMKPGSGCSPNIPCGWFPIPINSIEERSTGVSSGTSSNHTQDLALNFQDFASVLDGPFTYEWAEHLFLERVQDPYLSF